MTDRYYIDVTEFEFWVDPSTINVQRQIALCLYHKYKLCCMDCTLERVAVLDAMAQHAAEMEACEANVTNGIQSLPPVFVTLLKTDGCVSRWK